MPVFSPTSPPTFPPHVLETRPLLVLAMIWPELVPTRPPMLLCCLVVTEAVLEELMITPFRLMPTSPPRWATLEPWPA